jgi:hypothetical protein
MMQPLKHRAERPAKCLAMSRNHELMACQSCRTPAVLVKEAFPSRVQLVDYPFLQMHLYVYPKELEQHSVHAQSINRF